MYKNRYEILRKLGEGGSSMVYMATDTKSGCAVTIKCIKSDEEGALSKGSAREEAGILKILDHKALPKVIEVFEDAFVLEYIPGNSLDKYLRHRGKLREKEAVRIAMELIDILKYLHSRKTPVIYRDLKPANIIIKPDGHVCLIDFGAARLYQSGDGADTLNLGTYGFAAPEQFGNLGQTDPRTDIYCLGKTLEQIIKGRPTRELWAIIDKCTKPDREDRFRSCSEIEKELKLYPSKHFRNRMIHGIKISFMATAAASVIAFTANNYENVRSYAAYDAQARIPAVKDRLGNAGIRIKDFFLDRFGIDIDKEVERITAIHDEYAKKGTDRQGEN